MKKRFQRLISFALVLVMLVTMIPVGIFSANAEVSAELSAGLADYENATEFVINSVEDWKALSEYALPDGNRSFNGKTIKLGADIDANGEALPTLFNALYGNFDGQNHVIKNVNVASDAVKVALISQNFGGGSIKNVKFDNVTITATNASVQVALVVATNSAWADLTAENIAATNITINAAGGEVGGLFARQINNKFKMVYKNLSFEGDINVSAAATAGAIFSNFYYNAGYTADIAAGNYTYENIYAAANFTDTTNTSTYGGFGGKVGISGHVLTSNKNAIFSNVYIGGIMNNKANSFVSNGMFGNVQGTQTQDVMHLSNVISDITWQAAQGNNTAFMYAANGNITYDTLYSTHATGNGAHASNRPRNFFTSQNGATFFNGIYFASNAAAENTVNVISSIQAKMMPTKDANGYMTGLGAVPTADAMNAALAAYDTTDTFTITNTLEWAAIAASGKTFAGKTVKLGNNIDAAGTALPVLFAQFAGTFDGQNHTIKNVTNPATQEALIAKTVNGNATIKNVKFDKINMALATSGSAGSGLLIGANIGTTTTSLTVQNISVTNSTVNATSNSVGALIGVLAKTGPVAISDITLDNVNLTSTRETASLIWAGSWGALNGITVRNIKATNSSVTGKSGVSGMFSGIGTNVTGTNVLFENIIADVDVTVNAAGTAQASLFMASAGQNGADQTWTFRNIKVTGTYTDQFSGGGNVGGMFGKMTINAGGNFNVENCYVGGKISTLGERLATPQIAGPAIGGLAGYQEMTGVSPKVTVKNFVNTLYYDSLIRGRAILVAGGTSSPTSVFNYTNVTTTNKIDRNNDVRGQVRYYFVWNNNVTVNGTAVAGEISQSSTGARTDILTVSAEKAEAMVVYDQTTGYIKSIKDHINAEAIQYSEVSDGKYAIRFVALTQMTEVNNANMIVTANVKDAEGNVIQTLTFDSADFGGCTLYDGLTVWDEQGIKDTVTAVDVGAERLIAFTIGNIPVGNAITFEVTTYHADNHNQTLAGTNVLSVDFDAQGAYVE